MIFQFSLGRAWAALLPVLSLSPLAAPAQSSAAAGPQVVHLSEVVADPAPTPFGGFGLSMDGDGSRIVIGEPFHMPEGRAHVLVRLNGNWVPEDELAPPDGALFDYFGSAVGIDGDTVVVGAYGADPNFTGAAYVFERLGGVWAETAKLVSSNGSSSDLFGRAVAIAGDRIAVGAPSHAGNAFLSGAVYVFARSGGGWVEEAYLVAQPPSVANELGYTLALSEDTVAAGAYNGVAGLSDPGSVVTWTRSGSTWTSEQLLVAPDPLSAAQLGAAVAIDGTRIAAGAPGAAGGGAVYVFERDPGGAWSQSAKLQTAETWFGPSLGLAVDIAEKRIAGGSNGTASVFDLGGTGWQERALLLPVGFGGPQINLHDVAVVAEEVFLGLPYASLGTATQCGLVPRAELSELGEPLGSHYCAPAVANSTGLPANIQIGGSSEVSADALHVAALDLPSGKTGLFLFGAGQGIVLPAGSIGRLCIAGSLLVRVPESLQIASDFGTLYFELGTDELPAIGAFQPGETWNFQAWYRDIEPAWSNLTDAVSVTFR